MHQENLLLWSEKKNKKVHNFIFDNRKAKFFDIAETLKTLNS